MGEGNSFPSGKQRQQYMGVVCGGALGFVFPLSPEIVNLCIWVLRQKINSERFPRKHRCANFNNPPRIQKQLIKVALYCNSNAVNNVCIVIGGNRNEIGLRKFGSRGLLIQLLGTKFIISLGFLTLCLFTCQSPVVSLLWTWWIVVAYVCIRMQTKVTCFFV